MSSQQITAACFSTHFPLPLSVLQCGMLFFFSYTDTQTIDFDASWKWTYQQTVSDCAGLKILFFLPNTVSAFKVTKRPSLPFRARRLFLDKRSNLILLPLCSFMSLSWPTGHLLHDNHDTLSLSCQQEGRNKREPGQMPIFCPSDSSQALATCWHTSGGNEISIWQPAGCPVAGSLVAVTQCPERDILLRMGQRWLVLGDFPLACQSVCLTLAWMGRTRGSTLTILTQESVCVSAANAALTYAYERIHAYIWEGFFGLCWYVHWLHGSCYGSGDPEKMETAISHELGNFFSHFLIKFWFHKPWILFAQFAHLVARGSMHWFWTETHSVNYQILYINMDAGEFRLILWFFWFWFS